MKNIISIMTALTLIFGPTLAWAEPKIYIRSDGQFVADGNEYPRGFWVPVIEGAENVFSVHPEAQKSYEEHKRMGRWFGILNWGSVGLLAVYAVASGDNFDTGVGLAVFFVPWIAGLFVGANSQKHLLRAINIVNGVSPEQAGIRFLKPPALKSSSLTLPVLAWSF